ncbi:ER membrane protein complex subunit 7 homolog isoform X2 [Punica granatum]|uniref:ER membrane protein complex subunit 7 homolog isoform X2 n=2 Tax=Punica granatum TaxID=22663 RepID=A0A6P8E876_PUNGR|nr:ER membrane protein complex subunit 7 homolog isoform X2 [Punica granatum]
MKRTEQSLRYTRAQGCGEIAQRRHAAALHHPLPAVHLGDVRLTSHRPHRSPAYRSTISSIESILAMMELERWGPSKFLPTSRLLIVLAFVSCLSCVFVAGRSADGYTINGRVKIPSAGAKGFGLLGKISDVKVILNGGQKVTFLRPDGYFSFYNVPAGTHLIEVAAIGYFFSPVRVDVSARNPGKVQAALTENRRGLIELVLEPLREEQYYEIREPFSIMSVVKSPMGLMMGFMLIVVFLMPKLVENMDPEEMRRAQEEMRSQGVPSLSSLLPSAARN